jgi:hypothetical protein
MAITRTVTHTATYTRIALIKLQISRVLERSSISARVVAKVLEGIEQKWISEVSVYGLDQYGTCCVEIFMKIDWVRNQFHVSAGGDEVTIDKRWHGGISVEVEKAMALFEEVASAENLDTTVYVRYTPGIDVERARAELGFVAAEKVRWKDGVVGTAMSIPELDEFTVGIRLSGG